MTQLERLVGSSNELTAQLLAHLAEVDARGRYPICACATLYAYCEYERRLSEDEAQRRASRGSFRDCSTCYVELLERARDLLQHEIREATLLELHHREAYAKRGPTSLEHLTLHCRHRAAVPGRNTRMPNPSKRWVFEAPKGEGLEIPRLAMALIWLLPFHWCHRFSRIEALVEI